MRYRPTFEEFAELAKGSSLVPVYRQLIGDTLTPVTAFCKVQEGEWSFLFESVVGGEILGRYSFLGSQPFLRFQAYGPRIQLHSRPADGTTWTCAEFTDADPIRVLEEKLKKYHAPHVPGLPRFCGGAVGFAGYDAVRYVEHLPNAPQDDRQLPDLCFAFYDRMVIFDHINKTIAVVAHAHVDSANLRQCYDTACQRVDRLVERLQQEGTCWASGTTWQGMAALRLSVSNYATTEADIDRTAEAILRSI